jgi:hypothetical protein
MKIVTRLFFIIGVLIFCSSYLIYPYKVNEGDIIIIDEDVVGFLQMLYTALSIVFGGLFLIFLGIYKDKKYTIFSCIMLIFSLIFLYRTFVYFGKFMQ